MKLVTVPQMIAIEKDADANGLSYDQMMRNAGFGLAEVVADILSDNDWDSVFGLVGPGNNGGLGSRDRGGGGCERRRGRRGYGRRCGCSACRCYG